MNEARNETRHTNDGVKIRRAKTSIRWRRTGKIWKHFMQTTLALRTSLAVFPHQGGEYQGAACRENKERRGKANIEKREKRERSGTVRVGEGSAGGGRVDGVEGRKTVKMRRFDELKRA